MDFVFGVFDTSFKPPLRAFGFYLCYTFDVFALACVSRRLCAGPDAAVAAAFVLDLVLWAGGDGV